MSLASGDLTTVTDMNTYFGTSTSVSILGPLISRVSRMVLTELNRSLLVPKNYIEQFNGTGTRSLVLPNWPVLDLTSLVISGSSLSISPQVDTQEIVTNPYGWRLQPWDGLPPGDPAVIELTGGAQYYFGAQNVVASYRAGYQVSDEVVPSTSGVSYSPLIPYGIWATDEGVIYTTNGTSLTKILSGTPLVGQYVSPVPDAISSPTTSYTFNAADIATGIEVSYGFIPYDLEQGVLEWAAERFAYRNRVGVRQQVLAAQETIAYDLSGISRFVQQTLGGYISTLPPAIGANV